MRIELNSVIEINSKMFNGAFSKCSNLTHVTMNTIQIVSANSFQDCSNLIYIDMPNARNIYSGAFV